MKTPEPIPWPADVAFPPTVRIRFDPPLDLHSVSWVVLCRMDNGQEPGFAVVVNDPAGQVSWDLIAKPGDEVIDGIPTVIAGWWLK